MSEDKKVTPCVAAAGAGEEGALVQGAEGAPNSCGARQTAATDGGAALQAMLTSLVNFYQ